MPKKRVPKALAMKELNICGTPHDIIFCDTTEDVGTQEEPLYGTISYDQQFVKVYKAPKWEETFKTLLHEILHGLRTQAGIALEDPHEEDHVCDVQSNMLTDFLIRNKLLKMIEVEV